VVVNDLLFELQTEELPPKSLSLLIKSLVTNIKAELTKSQLAYTSVTGYATPRRLAFIVRDLAEQQPNQSIERRGPALQAAYDSDGKPSKALAGFLRSCGLDNADLLENQETPKGTWLVYQQHKSGGNVRELISQIILKSLSTLPIDRKMHWGASRVEFVRPVHSLILLYGEEVLPTQILNCESGRTTVGHRFMSNGLINIKSANDYVKVLKDNYVIVDFEERKTVISQQLAKVEAIEKARVIIDPELLDEVTSLVEWPVALSGKFDAAFLSVPEEALISAMKSHQRYFHLVDLQGKLLPRFVTIANIESKDPNAVIKGNERVISPRLADAAFFYRRDQQTTLESNLERLSNVVFQAKLGTYLDKAKRIAHIAGFIAQQTGADASLAQRAGLLCKADLVSAMVGEFPELQGLMGGYYAEHDGEPTAVVLAIKEHYLPSFSGGELPTSAAGQAVAIADKLDTLTGLFGINQPPTGSKDPFALRRQTLGVIRICIQAELKLDIRETLAVAAGQHSPEFSTTAVYDYLLDRLGTWYQDQGIPGDTFNAVRFSHQVITNLADCDRRVRSIQDFRTQPQAEHLIAANKRVANILKKAGTIDAAIDTKLFQAPAEIALFAALGAAEKAMQTQQNGADQDYEAKCLTLAGLQSTIDAYFDEVMVMADEPAVRSNRLATLQKMRFLFLDIADFSLLQ
jgi:glycyl-tRNA synthetase beta chain